MQIFYTFECSGQISQILVIFETADRFVFFFKFCINLQGHET